MEIGTASVLSVLVLVAFGLLVLVTGGVTYLTLVDWRDRRRQDTERREARRR
jgi:CHASE3 domain sensor protein